ncbi:MAG: GntR family transcriptional regulator [Neptuniibacter sp.]
MAISINAEVKKQIENKIISGELKPGDRLDETTLAQEYGVSRTPVREALLQLQTIGLIELRARKGAIVASIEFKELFEMFEVMAELEGMCGHLAARRASPEDLKNIEAEYNKCAEAASTKDSDLYYQVNTGFHEAIYQAAHNGYLSRKTINLRNRLAPYRRTQLRNENRITDSMAEHLKILKAIQARNPDKAKQLLIEHISVQGNRFSDLVACF